MLSRPARASLVASAVALTSISLCARSLAQTAYIGSNFSGSYYGSTEILATPPDSMGAVGPNHYVELLNGVFATYTKTGTLVGTRSTDTQFWTDAFTNAGTPFNPGSTISDPRLIFDHQSQRWFAVEVTTTGPDYQVMVARSNTSDPTQGFKAVKFAATTPGGNLPDYPTLGIDANGLYIGANSFPDDKSNPTLSLYSIPKSDLLQSAPSAANLTAFTGKNTSVYGWTAQPVVDFSATKSAAAPVFAIPTSAPQNTTTLRKLTITGSAGAGATLSPPTSITVPAYTAPPAALQPGGAPSLDSIDGRLQGSVYQVRNDIWAVHSVSVAGHAAIRWYHINASNNAVIASGTLSDPSFDYTQPSICANTSGNVVIGFTRSGATQGSGFAGSYAFVGSTLGSATTFGSIMQLKAGLSTYAPDPTAGDQRWGDYSATTLDPADPGIFWTTQEYARQGNVWGVQTSEIVVPGVTEVRWKNATDGSFATGGNWLGNAAPNVNSHVILSRPTDAAPYAVSLNKPTTVTRLSARQGTETLDLGGAALTLTATSSSTPSLTVGEFAGSPRLTIRNGSLSTTNTSLAPGLGSDAGLTLDNVAWAASADVTLGSTSAGRAALNLTGTTAATIAGAVTLNANTTLTNAATTLTAASLTLSDGRLVDSAGGARTLRTTALSITGAGQADLNDNGLILDFTGDVTPVEASLRSYLVSGYDAGHWDGPGLASTSAGTNPIHTTALAYAKSADLGMTSFAGQTIDDTALLVKYTLYGDANLNGKIDTQDYQFLDDAYQNFFYPSWSHGDFNYDGCVDVNDYFLIDVSFGRQSGLAPDFLALREGEFGRPYVDRLLAAVPEPGTAAALLATACPSLLVRRRRR